MGPDTQADAACRTSLKEQWLSHAIEQLQQDPQTVLAAVSCALQQLVQVSSLPRNPTLRSTRVLLMLGTKR